MPTGSVKIDTVPLPENPISLEFRIPPDLIKEFGAELRVVIRHPWVIGIPVIERLLKPEVLKAIGKDFEVVITPKQFGG